MAHFIMSVLTLISLNTAATPQMMIPVPTQCEERKGKTLGSGVLPVSFYGLLDDPLHLWV